jgi:uncharacterized protein (DUF2384 family)
MATSNSKAGKHVATTEKLPTISRSQSRVAKGRKPGAVDPENTASVAQPRSALELANDVMENPELWLRTANPQLGDRSPIDLIGTSEEFRVHNLLNAVDQGLF